MGMVLFPFLIIHAAIFLLGIVWLGVKTKTFINFLKFVPLSLLLCFSVGYLSLLSNFYYDQNSRQSAWEVLFSLFLGKYSIILLAISAVLFLLMKDSENKFYHAMGSAILMSPFSSIILFFIFGKKMYSIYNISIFY